jgi:hypothetical protein
MPNQLLELELGSCIPFREQNRYSHFRSYSVRRLRAALGLWTGPRIPKFALVLRNFASFRIPRIPVNVGQICNHWNFTWLVIY